MGKKLLQKAIAIGVPKGQQMARPHAPEERGLDRPTPLPSQSNPTASTSAVRTKTAPGQMLGFMREQSSAIKEVESLKERLAEFEGGQVARLIDPKRIVPSIWANRHESNFDGPEFAELKAELQSAGGNIQPIKVRPLVVGEGVGPSNPHGAGEAEFEIIFGHRRHRACLELGLPVLAIVEPIDAQTLFVQMERENRSRKNLSAWEQGMMYARALDQGLYSSNRQLASAIGRDLGDVGKALALARLPILVVNAFASPLDLQYRWAKPLSEVQQKDPEGVIARAEALRSRASTMSPKEILAELLGEGPGKVGGTVGSNNLEIAIGGKSAGVMTTDSRGNTLIRLDVSISEEQRLGLLKMIQGYLEK
jgi:ParB family chromosome partitioning protein